MWCMCVVSSWLSGHTPPSRTSSRTLTLSVDREMCTQTDRQTHTHTQTDTHTHTQTDRQTERERNAQLRSWVPKVLCQVLNNNRNSLPASTDCVCTRWAVQTAQFMLIGKSDLELWNLTERYVRVMNLIWLGR